MFLIMFTWNSISNHFLMDVWWNNHHFSCKDLESSNWNNHFKVDVSGSRYITVPFSWRRKHMFFFWLFWMFHWGSPFLPLFVLANKQIGEFGGCRALEEWTSTDINSSCFRGDRKAQTIDSYERMRRVKMRSIHRYNLELSNDPHGWCILHSCINGYQHMIQNIIRNFNISTGSN